MSANALQSHGLWAESPPDDARWPRLATARHPKAVGTYGPTIEAWANERPEIHGLLAKPGLRWWQRFVLSRAFEHDDDGHLLWSTALVSAPRQVGKSWLERVICCWRMHQTQTFGRVQDVLHVAHKLQGAQEVWRPAARWASGGHGSVRWANGEQKIELEDGSRWLIQAATDGAGVAFSLSMVLVDEAWSVDRKVVDGAILPTMAEAIEPQLWLVSTAGDSSSDLMMAYRALALAFERPEPDSSLLMLEWSAPPDPDLDIDDPVTWRMASPHWSARREVVVRQARGTSTEIEFRHQWLNQWVPTMAEPVFSPEDWNRQEWTTPLPGGALSFGADVAADRSHAAIVAYSAGVAEVVEAKSGAAWVAGRLIDLAARWEPVGIGLDGSGPAATVADELAGSEIGHLLVPLTARQMATASGLTYDSIKSGRLWARAHGDLTQAVYNAKRRPYGQSWAFARQVGDVSAVTLLAVVVGQWADEHRPALVERSQIW